MRWPARSPVAANPALPEPAARGAQTEQLAPWGSGPEHSTERIVRPAPSLSGAAANGSGQPHDTQVLDTALAAAAADPFRDTTMLVRPRQPVADQPRVPLMSRERAAEVGIYSGSALMLVAVVGIAARLWAQWDGVERLVTTSLAAASLILGGLWLRAPWGRPASEACARGVSVMLATGVIAGGVGSALLFGLGQSSDPVAGLGHALCLVIVLVAANAVARTAYSETALLGALTWLGWIGLPDGLSLTLGLMGLGVAWVAVGIRLAKGPRTAAVMGVGLALSAGAVMAAETDAWVARGVLGLLGGFGLWAFLTGRPNYWLGVAAASTGALAAGIAMDALSPAPALLAGGFAITTVSAVAMRGATRRGEQADADGADPELADSVESGGL